MEYVFGLDDFDNETLKTIGKTHSNLSGVCQIVREYDVETIKDSFHVVRKERSLEDSDLCYDWYRIDRHDQSIDYTPRLEGRTVALEDASSNVDELLVDQEYRLTCMELGV